jgi:type I restriction enzyme M protein
MPGGVFKPYAGVATAILIFTKGGKTEQTWFYEMKSDGYELNDKRTEKMSAGGSRDYGDLHDIIAKYKTRNQGKESDRTAQYFFIPRAEMEENEYNLSFGKYKEELYEEVTYEDPQTILNKLVGEDGKSGIEMEIIEGIKELKALL